MAIATLNELTQLSEELNMKTIRQYILRNKIYNEQGNKSGKLLAKAVQNNVHHNTPNQG